MRRRWFLPQIFPFLNHDLHPQAYLRNSWKELEAGLSDLPIQITAKARFR
jgi:hypothetical protein